MNALSFYVMINSLAAGVTKEKGLLPVKFFSAVQLYCSRFSVGLLSYDSISTLLRLDCRKNWTAYTVNTRPNFSWPWSCFAVVF